MMLAFTHLGLFRTEWNVTTWAWPCTGQQRIHLYFFVDSWQICTVYWVIESQSQAWPLHSQRWNVKNARMYALCTRRRKVGVSMPNEQCQNAWGIDLYADIRLYLWPYSIPLASSGSSIALIRLFAVLFSSSILLRLYLYCARRIIMTFIMWELPSGIWRICASVVAIESIFFLYWFRFITISMPHTAMQRPGSIKPALL